MSGITSGIGLISGIDRAQLIEQLIAIEARPITTLQNRIRGIDVRRTAFMELEAKLLGMQNAVTRFTSSDLFRNFSAASSDEDALTATAGTTAATGSYSFRVRSLATQHAMISRGFADADRTPVGSGTITVERGEARVDRRTELDTLNGGNGIRRGTITITDRSGATATIDLTAALTIDDVLEAVNSQTSIRVQARVTGLSSVEGTGDRIVLEDETGLAEGSLIVTDRSGGFAAADLGIATASATGRIDGHDLIRLTDRSSLSALNDGNGVDRFALGLTDDLLFETSYGSFGVSLSDLLKPETDLRVLNNGQGVRLGVIRIADRSGKSAEIDLAGAVTVGDIRERIEAADVSVSVAIVNSNLQITDSSDTPETVQKNLIVEDVSGYAAADLGIIGNVSASSITGRDIHRVSTIGDVLRAINHAPGNSSLVEASLSADGKSIELRAVGFENQVQVHAAGGSNAARDLGLLDATFTSNTTFETQRLIGGLNTVLLRSLNGGTGLTPGTVRFTNSASQSSVIDFSAATTIQDVIDTINADSSLSLRATLNDAGNGITLRDESNGNGLGISIEDVTGNFAEQLGIATQAQAAPSRSIQGTNLQFQYVSRQTKLAELNPAVSAFSGEFRITDSSGGVHTVSIASNLTTVGQVIDAINLRVPDTLEARINERGDGIVILDRSGGAGKLSIEDINGGQAAAGLRIAGSAKAGEAFIDGSAEVRIEVNARDTLRDVAGKLNAAGAGLSASVLNDGRSVNPFSLAITSGVSGVRGALVIDSGGAALSFETLARAQDAVLSIGGAGSGTKVIASPTNTVTNVVEGLSLEIRSPSERDITVTVNRDVDSIAESIRALVDGYNDVQADIDEQTSFNQETLERGPLLGDSTVNLVRSRLHRILLQPFGGTESAGTFLTSVGIRKTANNRLEFDEEKFKAAYENDPQAVEQLFTDSTRGLGTVLKTALESLTQDTNGVFAQRDTVLADQQELLNRRIDGLNELLEAKRARLDAQFIALESALAGLQGQQSALTQLLARQTTAR